MSPPSQHDVEVRDIGRPRQREVEGCGLPRRQPRWQRSLAHNGYGVASSIQGPDLDADIAHSLLTRIPQCALDIAKAARGRQTGIPIDQRDLALPRLPWLSRGPIV